MTVPEPGWVTWVAAARKNDASAREQLEQYFSPFVHAIAVAHVAHHLSGAMVKHVLAAAAKNLSALKNDADYGTWLLELARKMSTDAARGPGAATERTDEPELAPGRRVLSKLRTIADPTRERLAMRLLEGVPGSEISEVVRADSTTVRSDLERGLTQLTQLVTGTPVSAAGDSYLWSSIGAPHAAVVPLENELTPLRYDPFAEYTAELGSTGQLTPETTPLTGAPLPARSAGEGKRPTPAALIPPPEDEDHTSPVGVKLVEDPTTTGEGLALPKDPGFGDESTIPVTDLPAAARPQNPFEVQPSTIQATDLPVAAQVVHTPGPWPSQSAQGPVPASSHGRRTTGNPAAVVARAFDGVAPLPSRPGPPVPEVTRQAPPDPDATAAKGSSVAMRASAPHAPPPAAKKEEDSTAPRGVPLSILAREHQPAPLPDREAGEDWRTRPGDFPAPLPEPSVPRVNSPLARGWYPFAIAGVLLVVSVVVAWVNLRSTERIVRRGWNLVPVLTAATNIAEGTIITMDVVAQRMVPEQFVTSSVVKPDSVGFVLNQPIEVAVQAGDPLLWAQFASTKTMERLSGKVSKKARAYGLDVGGTVAVGGWVRPGDSVDIVFTVDDPAKHQKMAVTLLEAIPVVATGKLTSTSSPAAAAKGNEQTQYRHVSVLVMPEEAEMLALVRSVGTFKFTLRAESTAANPSADVMEQRGRSTMDTLLSGERAKLLQKKRNETIQLIRGSASGKDDGPK